MSGGGCGSDMASVGGLGEGTKGISKHYVCGTGSYTGE